MDLVRRDREARHQGERDAPAEQGRPISRATGGGSSAPTEDSHSTTGTTSSETFVGRAGGDEAGTETGAEARGDERLDDQGAARDD
jgi:hypothetical protein